MGVLVDAPERREANATIHQRLFLMSVHLRFPQLLTITYFIRVKEISVGATVLCTDMLRRKLVWHKACLSRKTEITRQ